MTAKKLVAIYVRSATSWEAVKKQVLRLKQIVHLKFGDEARIKIYKDVGSGLDPNNLGLQQLMRDIQSNKIANIFVTDSARLTRDSAFYCSALELFKKHGVKLFLKYF